MVDSEALEVNNLIKRVGKVVYLIYYYGNNGIMPIITASTIKMVDEFIRDNQRNFDKELTYMKLNYKWK